MVSLQALGFTFGGGCGGDEGSGWTGRGWGGGYHLGPLMSLVRVVTIVGASWPPVGGTSTEGLVLTVKRVALPKV